MINPDTGTYTQTADLPVEYRKFPIDDGRIYPTRQVLQIIRVKRIDGSEWLKSRGRLIGLDKAGDEVQHSFTDPEVFYKPITRHKFRKEEKDNPYSKTKRVCRSWD